MNDKENRRGNKLNIEVTRHPRIVPIEEVSLGIEVTRHPRPRIVPIEEVSLNVEYTGLDIDITRHLAVVPIEEMNLIKEYLKGKKLIETCPTHHATYGNIININDIGHKLPSEGYVIVIDISYKIWIKCRGKIHNGSEITSMTKLIRPHYKDGLWSKLGNCPILPYKDFIGTIVIGDGIKYPIVLVDFEYKWKRIKEEKDKDYKKRYDEYNINKKKIKDEALKRILSLEYNREWNILKKESDKQIEKRKAELDMVNKSIQNITDFTFASIKSFQLRILETREWGEEYPCQYFNDVPPKLCEILIDRHTVFNIDMLNLQLGGTYFYHGRKGTNPKQIKDTDIFVETNFDNNKKIELCYRIIKIFGYSDNDLRINIKNDQITRLPAVEKPSIVEEERLPVVEELDIKIKKGTDDNIGLFTKSIINTEKQSGINIKEGDPRLQTFNEYSKYIGEEEFDKLINTAKKRKDEEDIKRQAESVNKNQFIQKIQDAFFMAGYKFSKLQIINHLTCLIAQQMLGHSGIPGSGKDSLAIGIAKLVCEDYNEQVLEIPANKSLDVDDKPIIGYQHALKEKYQYPPFLYQFKKASKSEKRPYFTIIDEANVANPDSYLTSIVRAIESASRKITFTSYRDDDTKGIEQELTVPNNVFIIFTMNIYETRHILSQMMLDRMNIIDFRDPNLMGSEDLESDNIYKDLSFDPIIAHLFNKYILDNEFRKITISESRYKNIDYREWEKQKIDQIKELLQNIDIIFKKNHLIYEQFSFRTQFAILRYLYSAKDFCKDEKTMIDLQILQKVIPRIENITDEYINAVRQLRELLSNHPLLPEAKKCISIEKLDDIIWKIDMYGR